MRFSHKNRKIGYTYGSLSGRYSFRAEKSIAFESSLERDLLLLLEFNESVVDVIEQPVTIEYQNHNGRTVTYTPDFLVHFEPSPIGLMSTPYPKSLLIEVKPHEKIKKDFVKLKRKFKIGVKYARENDLIFKIYDESRIRTIELDNINFLKRYKRRSYDPSEEERILGHLGSIGHTAVDHLLAFLYVSKEQRGIALAQIWHLISSKKIGTDIGSPLNLHSIIWLNINDNYKEAY